MSRKEPGFAERLQTAAKAKQALLEKLRATTLGNNAQSAERVAKIEADAALKKDRKAVRPAKYSARKARQK
jgi:Family of unknown function (DUF6481)